MTKRFCILARRHEIYNIYTYVYIYIYIYIYIFVYSFLDHESPGHEQNASNGAKPRPGPQASSTELQTDIWIGNAVIRVLVARNVKRLMKYTMLHSHTHKIGTKMRAYVPSLPARLDGEDALATVAALKTISVYALYRTHNVCRYDLSGAEAASAFRGFLRGTVIGHARAMKVLTAAFKRPRSKASPMIHLLYSTLAWSPLSYYYSFCHSCARLYPSSIAP